MSKQNKKYRINPKLKLFFKIFAIMMLIGVVVAGGIIAGALFGFIDTTGGINIEDLSLNYTSFVYSVDENGVETEYENLYDSQNRVWTDYADISPYLVKAFVAIEDQRFYEHNGVDIKSTSKAALGWITRKSGSRGGSTITQQLVKNLTGDNKRSPLRKVKEMVTATNLERKLSKEQILELYMNSIYLSQGCYGVGSASQIYFGKDASELSIAESASLAGITQYPTKYDPIQNPKNNKEKQELVLQKMQELGYINATEYKDAVAEKLVYKRGVIAEVESKQSYFVDRVIDDVLKDLEDLGYTKSSAEKLLYTGGLKIYATVDTDVQKVMEEVFTNPKNFPLQTSETPAQSAMVITEPTTGQIKGIVGGIGEKSGNRTLNRACQSKRQPGSTIKPLGVYAPAIEKDLVSQQTQYMDKKISYGNYSPKNYYSGFRGPMSIRYATEISNNTIPVQLLNEVGLDYSYEFVHDKLGIKSLEKFDKALAPLALGGLTYGATPLEMAAAYSSFANEGMFNEPTSYTKVLDHKGKVLLEKHPNPQKAMSKQTAFIMTDMLGGVVKTGTGTGANFTSKYPLCGKTGTTDDDKDRWYIGFSPYYVGAVWFGYDQPKVIPNLPSNPAINPWRLVMSKIDSVKKLKSTKFIRPSGISSISICAISGNKPGESCKSVRNVYVKSDQTTQKICTSHEDEKGLFVCEVGKSVAGKFCPKETCKEVEKIPEGYSEEPCTVHLTEQAPPTPSPNGGSGNANGDENAGGSHGGTPTTTPSATDSSGNGGGTTPAKPAVPTPSKRPRPSPTPKNN